VKIDDAAVPEVRNDGIKKFEKPAQATFLA
jgi:hypothetical protein